MILLGVLAAILGISLLIVIHEAGHFLVARAFGMKVERFSVGFGKVLLRTKRGGTEFVVSALPLGGYVKIVGMAPGEDVDPADPHLYSNQPAWRRFLAILAGPAANYLTAVLLAFGLLLGSGLLRTDGGAVIGPVQPGTPAAAAGLQDGDRVRKIAGRPVETWNELVTAIRTNPGKELPVLVERGGERLELRLTPQDEKGTGKAGFGKHRFVVTSPGPGPAIAGAFRWTYRESAEQVTGFGAIFSGQKSGGIDNVGGPLAIVQQFLGAFAQGAGAFVNALWVISIALAVLNLLPIPGLDGSRLVFLAYELVARRRVNARIENAIHSVGIVALFALIAYVTVFNDLGLGKKLLTLLGR
ncbi:MAG TPA: M50 family metallopeptidase [Anaeromyxobacter sp.]|nr:M50 family metallopeptidase [Anaeromyxobacter sp.]